MLQKPTFHSEKSTGSGAGSGNVHPLGRAVGVGAIPKTLAEGLFPESLDELHDFFDLSRRK